MQIPVSSAQYGDIIGGAIQLVKSVSSVASSSGATLPAELGQMAVTATSVLKPQIDRGGTVSGTSGYMAVQYPYIVFHHPNLALPPEYKDISGYPSLMSGKLGDFSGYTKIEECHVDGLTCTQNESDEIHQLLLNGIII